MNARTPRPTAPTAPHASIPRTGRAPAPSARRVAGASLAVAALVAPLLLVGTGSASADPDPAHKGPSWPPDWSRRAPPTARTGPCGSSSGSPTATAATGWPARPATTSRPATCTSRPAGPG
ncbi:hypothetical protein ACFQ0M_04165 [Kitasatospora aburaviensis]